MREKEENLGLNHNKRRYHKPTLIEEQVFTAEGACTPTCGKTGGGCNSVAGKCQSNKNVS